MLKELLLRNAKEYKTSYKNRKRIMFLFFVIAALMTALALRMGWHMIIRGDEYAQKAVAQQTSDSVVAAVRGKILDRNGDAMALSASTNTIWVRPSTVRKNGKTDAEIEGNARAEAAKISQILNLDEASVYETITSERMLIRLAKFVDDEKADELRKEQLAGIEIVAGVRRYYPLNTFACQIIGLTNDDGDGLTGLEKYYNRYLSGINGRWITSKDNKKNSLVYGTNKYYKATDGYTIVTTIDQTIQHIVEEKIAENIAWDEADRVSVIIMDPNNGDILAMAQSDKYDPNDPRAPQEGDEVAFAAMSDEEKLEYWNRRWRAFNTSDVYEPGSVFKLVTAAIALDCGVTDLNDHFYCGGATTVKGRFIKCWNYPAAHGNIDLAHALFNSCNVTMTQLVDRIGKDRYYEGLERFGFTTKTGVDFPGEGSNIVYSKEAAGEVELATMSFGQGIALTPLSMVTAVSAIANGGYILEPHFVKEIRDADGNVVESYGRTVKSIAMTTQTANELLEIMREDVELGFSGKTKLDGYNIGGKTGTAQKPSETGGYSEYVYASIANIAPTDDPKLVMITLVDSPRYHEIWGSTVASPCAGAIMSEVLRYLNVEPQYTEDEIKAMQSKMRTVPDLTGDSYEIAAGKLSMLELKYVFSPELPEGFAGELAVTDQYPKPETEVAKESTVTLYYEIKVEEELPDDGNEEEPDEGDND